ncbi:LAETG motif-containing sortase-dependent surface protein [Streptantibioticus ferralitis]|uniref:LAETG motif-containing sortase-dependent surface protein n=1 Tax=Streptantibioticus ferralitis TaxID=236510 RepID=A0ABT5Z277_9ACTN|nr:LAETG motif-containing sortase-dependent surface protein [Streptantibioticus ferralitis]MDF2257946.1 LAETG motif-containing sortase-dependent surface protein [Streptantibioticus ferralitis]
MKLRRALVAVATTAAIAPAALMSAPSAFAADTAAPASSAPGASSTSSAPSTTATTSGTPSTAPSAAVPTPSTGSGSVPTSTQGTKPPTPGVCVVENPKYQAAVHTAITGLPGKIATGSGWHTFTLKVDNPSSTDVARINLFAGVGPVAKEAKAFSTSQVELQAYHPSSKQWKDVSDGSGHSVGYFGWGTLPAHTHFNVPMRIEVKKNAPIGKGLTLGAGFYLDKQYNCVATSAAAYKIQIVAPGTDTTGSTPQPQTGGEAPVPAPKTAPDNSQKDSANQVVPASATSTDSTTGGTLAHTGASSALPALAGAGAAAVALGAGAVFVVRRRKSGSTV